MSVRYNLFGRLGWMAGQYRFSSSLALLW
jgi:hypothetical protein